MGLLLLILAVIAIASRTLGGFLRSSQMTKREARTTTPVLIFPLAAAILLAAIFPR
jgi:hypothetical protein